MDVRNGVGGSRVFNHKIVDFHVFAFLEADAEVGLGQDAEVVADVGVFARHVDDHVAEGPFFDVLVLFGFQHAHEAEVLGRDFSVEVALENGVRHLVAEDDEPAATRVEQSLRTALNALDDAFVTFVEDDEHRVNLLGIRQFHHHFLFRELVEGTPQSPVSYFRQKIHAANVGKFCEMARCFGENR